MMKIRVLIALLLLIATTLGAASGPDGDDWRSLGPKEKRQLTLGIFLGLTMGASYGDMTHETATRLYLRMSQDEIVATFDRFYEEPLNRKIPLTAVWMVSAARGSGVDEETLKKTVADLRAAVSGKAPASATPPPTRHPEVYDIALHYADRSKKLRELLGDDVEYSNERANAWALGPDQGEAYVFFEVASSKGTGRMNGHAKRIGGKWVYDDLQVIVIGTGDMVDLLRDTVE